MEDNKDLNRIKVMLVENNEVANGLLSNWVKTGLLFQSGVQTHHDLRLNCYRDHENISFS